MNDSGEVNTFVWRLLARCAAPLYRLIGGKRRGPRGLERQETTCTTLVAWFPRIILSGGLDLVRCPCVPVHVLSHTPRSVLVMSF
jgi:hypothetical protein